MLNVLEQDENNNWWLCHEGERVRLADLNSVCTMVLALISAVSQSCITSDYKLAMEEVRAVGPCT